MMTKREIKTLKQAYARNGSLARTAQEFGMAPATLRRILKQNGVAIRPKGRPRVEDQR